MKPKIALGKYVLGLDVAMRNMGVVVFDTVNLCFVDYAVVSTAQVEGIYVIDSHVRNVRFLVNRLDSFVAFYQPTHAFAEFPHGGAKSSRAAVMMSLAIGGVVGLLTARNVCLVNVKPSDVKHLVRAKGKVEKAEVAEFVSARFGSIFDRIKKGKREHAFDAAGALLAANPNYYGTD